MRIALLDSGIGLLAAAAELRRLRPDADLVLSGDPAHMPWGPLEPARITDRALACARAALAERPDALIVACNTATVHALPALRAALEPAVPVIGTVPAIKPAAAGGGPFAVWATPATTGSDYQRRLLAEFAGGAPATEVPCHGLAAAVEAADAAAVSAAIKAAIELTPPETTSAVLGCTHYELVADEIGRQLTALTGRRVALHGSAPAVAAQALRRIGAAPAPSAPPTGGLTVLANGRRVPLPEPARRYAAGRALLDAPPTDR
ncbi:aspartate/glutamate racemase family protein [Streptomyces sp. DSM 44915]|uniref:Aspartate/glutamate racemase family protein n=1 Tax=Streptomyces chisholmiae TaxID=3075540 RepID=A0ABU2JUX7_9ACTN|nr:aspartate/glutamate racemase family protein [Streptomyces sp. DSM 44915]MDT0268795.1 aspartate/glutamate racemase family protein [Streptomyces sp. DSM 44915]